MEEKELTPRQQAQANAKRRRRAVTRGGASRLHLLAEIEAKRWREAEKKAKGGTGAASLEQGYLVL